MTNDPQDRPALDAGEDNPDLQLGEPVDPEHDVNVDQLPTEPDSLDGGEDEEGDS